jgi:hypothetical protein
MSDGSGGAPQLDERALEAATRAFVDAQEAGRVNEPSPYPLAEGIRAYLAAFSGAGGLDLTDDEMHALLAPATYRTNGPITLEAARSKLRARLDRKDDEG